HLWQKLWKSDFHNLERQTFPGLHKYMNWNGPIMTDSGGFQVFSLGFAREHRVGKIQKNQSLDTECPNFEKENLVRIEEDGVYFKTEGREQFLGPKESIQIQKQLCADIILAFYECTSPLHSYEYTKQALERTHRWEKICLEEHSYYSPSHHSSLSSSLSLSLSTIQSHSQLLYGNVQGGEYQDLREESAKYIGGLPFNGFAIGGSLGRSRSNAFDVLDWTIPLLPEEKPRHFLGIGKIEDVFDGVEAGVDSFDCVIPTREARHGRLWTARGHFDIMKGKFANDTSPIDKTCGCETCKTVTKKELRERFKSKDKNAARLATIHNVYFFNNLMSRIRDSIQNGTFRKLKKQFIHS
ncbi:MAG: tRNA guanosine(34) transglycosylase Tgt, partial [Candidatus Wolfebacteria bacterium]|nr:tRNA guanosine(34) transglycosylase Tgt [Candidatus Wolfebacteria bacterium]